MTVLTPRSRRETAPWAALVTDLFPVGHCPGGPDPLTGTFLPAGIGLVVLGLIRPHSLKRILQPRWLVLLALLFLLNVVFGGGGWTRACWAFRWQVANLVAGLQDDSKCSLDLSGSR